MLACFRVVSRAASIPILLLFLAIHPSPAAAVDDGIVYVRVPRSMSDIEIDDYQVSGSRYDTLPEVHFVKQNFNAPGQLIWRQDNGEETIIYDCMEGGQLPEQGDSTCVPMDPAISYDGRYLAFSVYHGWYDKRRRLHLVPPSSGEVGKLKRSYSGSHQSWAGIYIYDFVTGSLTAWPHQNRVWDTAPVWLPGNKMMFSSTRANIWGKWVTGLADRPSQLWIADVDADGTNPRNARNVDPHDQQNALHPVVHSSGRVFYSSHQTNKIRIEVTSVGGNHQTPNNLWWLMSTDLRGGDLNAHLHAHFFKWTGANDITLTALHFLGERSNGDMCSDMYYRRNNFGGGKIICWPARTANEDPSNGRAPLGHEGPYPFKSAQGYYVAVNGDSGDTGFGPSVHARDPAGLPGGQLLFAAGMGANSNCHWTSRDNGFTCDMGIYRSTRIPVRVGADHGYGLDDADVVINREEWHEFMPKPVMPYEDIYGVPEPTPVAPPSNTDTGDPGYGIFASTNAFIGDLKAYPGSKTTSGGEPLPDTDYWAGPGSVAWCAQQGCAMQALVRRPGGNHPHGDLEGVIKAVRFWETVPNVIRHDNGNRLYNIWGQELRLMGDAQLEADGSFKVKLPADVPFLMAGVDGEGRVIARHQQPMSMRPGEKQVCAGCHLHSTTDGENAENPFSSTNAGQIADSDAPELVRPPGYSSDMPEFTADVYSMLKQNCGSCHGGDQGSNNPILTDSAALVYRTLVNNMLPPSGGLKTIEGRDGEGGYSVALPWMTRYVNVFFARESLLYWKAAGERSDGRTDEERDDDFDFGPAHPHTLSTSDLRDLANWIDAGAYWDPSAIADNLIFEDRFEP